MMKAAIFESKGDPQEVLQVKKVAMPEPGEGEVRIKVSTCNINPSDVMFIHGLYGIRPQLPAVAGFEAAGSVDKCGEGVKLPEGMRVTFTAIGVWQEYVVVPAKLVIPVPEGMPDEVACQAFVNPFTAYGMLGVAGLEEGQYLMLTAGGSAFSKFVIQLAAARGIKVISVVRRDDQKEELMKLGAAAVINTSSEDLVKTIRTLTEKKGVDYVFEAVGGETGELALECLKQGGTMLVYGLLSLQSTPVNNGLVLFKDLTIKGFWLSTWMGNVPKEELMSITKTVFGSLASQNLQADTEKSYSLDEVKEAVAHHERPGRKGKVILDLRK
ncbi:MAG: zinc-dependent alcohol dehydrogenase family protein [Bacteroidota bacterium]